MLSERVVNMNLEDDLCGKILVLLESHGDRQSRERVKNFNYVHDSSLDSFELFSFIADVEGVFGVQFTPEELTYSDTHTVEGLARLIASKVKNPG
jgi:acyl carrier protein